MLTVIAIGLGFFVAMFLIHDVIGHVADEREDDVRDDF
jgi:hypothetical protein